MDIVDVIILSFRYAPLVLMGMAATYLLYLQLREARLQK
jgi:hypothetical protein